MNIEILKKVISIEALVESETNPGSFYKVGLDNEEWSCSCPNWKFGGGKFCKHILEVKEEI